MATKLPAATLLVSLTKPWLHLKVFQGATTNYFAITNYLSRVPEHYKKFYWEWKYTPMSPVHYIPKQGNFEKLPTGEVVAVQNVPLLLKIPKELHQGIWGGEAIVRGFQKRKQTTRRVPHYWVPSIKMTVVYSEILDRYMRLQVTERTLELIDKHYGFDNYILQTPPADLMSELALRLRREMLLTLVRETLYPDNPAKKQEILEKYKQHVIPEEEADWFGLSLNEANEKQKLIEEAANQPQPLKHAFRVEFIDYLKNKQHESEAEKLEGQSGGGWLSRVNPFAKK